MNISSIFSPHTPAIKNSHGQVIPGSVASLEKVKLGGIEQWITIRGYDVRNPLLLFLHGGPGSGEILFANLSKKKRLFSQLERSFVFVNWDQRGCGKSYSDLIPKESMNIKQFISDTRELAEILIKRFNKQKIYLVGHSWGSALATLVVQSYPELFEACVCIAPVVNMYEGEKISHQFALLKAKEANNQQAIKELEKFSVPVSLPNDSQAYLSNYLETKMKWLSRFSTTKYKGKIFRKLAFILLGLLSPEYSGGDTISFATKAIFSRYSMWNELMEINFFQQVLQLKVPTYFCLGRLDYIAPSQLTEKYYQLLEAPYKKLIWFDESGHSPHVEESKKFYNLMVTTILN